MKNLFLILTISALSLIILSFTVNSNFNLVLNPVGDGYTFEIPTDVQNIINKSCYSCHNSESNSIKGKMKLNFDKLPEMKVSKQVGKLMKIGKTVKKGSMPKKKFIEKYPDKALSKEESDKLISWADGLAQELSGE